jgi:hypothetical protein
MSEKEKHIDYKTEHLFCMHINFDKYPMCKRSIVFLDTMIKSGVSKTILSDDGIPIAIISVLLVHQTLATVYIIPSVDAHNCKKFSFIKGVLSLRDTLEGIVRKHGLKRVETLTLDNDKHNRWMEYLGFLPEGTKRCYGLNGEDFIMWSKLWV